MKKTALVIMAAGIGSRFGKGIKQLAPVGPNGEIIMEYSIYDALEAGFNKVVFIIRKDLEEEFSTEKYRFVSELHSAPKVYDKQSGKFVKELEKDDFLAYVTEVGEYILTEYVRADGERYGLLLDQNLEILADLPDLCDIHIPDETIYFDYKNGELRQCHLYSIQELIDLGKNYR